MTRRATALTRPQPAQQRPLTPSLGHLYAWALPLRQTRAVINVRPLVTCAAVLAAQIAGLWLVWRAVPEDDSWILATIGLAALAVYVAAAARSPDAPFAHVVAVYGTLFAVACLVYGMALHGQTPDIFDATGTVLCLGGAGTLARVVHPRMTPHA
jgi:small multidrug resistance family-3 protein